MGKLDRERTPARKVQREALALLRLTERFAQRRPRRLEQEGALAIQARVRSSFVAAQYRKEMKQRKAAATILQAGYRSYTSRSTMAAELLVQAPAAALLQGVIRGRQQRRADLLERKRRMEEQNQAAARVQAYVRGNKARAAGATSGAAAAALPPMELKLTIDCADGMLEMPIELGGNEEDLGMLTLNINISDGPPLEFDLLY